MEESELVEPSSLTIQSEVASAPRGFAWTEGTENSHIANQDASYVADVSSATDGVSNVSPLVTDKPQARQTSPKASGSSAANLAQEDSIKEGLGKPGAPGAPAVTYVGTTAIVLEWTKPEEDGGAPIIGYRIWVCKLGTLNLEPVPFVWIGLRDPHKLRQPGEALEPSALLRWNIEIDSQLGPVVFAVQAVNIEGAGDPSEDSIPVEHAVAVELLKRSLKRSRNEADLLRLLEYFQAKTISCERGAKKVAKIQQAKAAREEKEDDENSDDTCSEYSDISDTDSDDSRTDTAEDEDAALVRGKGPTEQAAPSRSTMPLEARSVETQTVERPKTPAPARPAVSDRALRLAQQLEASGLLDGPLLNNSCEEDLADTPESLLRCLAALQSLDMQLAPDAIAFLQSIGLAKKGMSKSQGSDELKLWQKFAGCVRANGGVARSLEKLEVASRVRPLGGAVDLLIDMGFEHCNASRHSAELPAVSAAQVPTNAKSSASTGSRFRQGQIDDASRRELLEHWHQVVAMVQAQGGAASLIATLGEAPLDALASLVPALRRAGLLCEDRGDTGGLGGTSCVALSEFLQECEAHGGVHQVLQCLRGVDLAELLRERAKEARCYCGRAPPSALELWKLDRAASSTDWQRLGRRIHEHGGVDNLMAALTAERERRMAANKDAAERERRMADCIPPRAFERCAACSDMWNRTMHQATPAIGMSSPSAAQAPRLGKVNSVELVTTHPPGPKPLSPAQMSISPSSLSQASRFFKGRSSPTLRTSPQHSSTLRTSPQHSRTSPTELEEGVGPLDPVWSRAGNGPRRRKPHAQVPQPSSPFNSGSTAILLPWEMDKTRTGSGVRLRRPMSE